MAKRQTKRRGYLLRRTKKRRQNKRQKGGGNDQTIYFVSSESPSRPGYPVMRVLSTNGDGMGGFTGIENYVSEQAYDIEDQLLSIKMNRSNKRTPKHAIVKKIVIKKPIYLPKI